MQAASAPCLLCSVQVLGGSVDGTVRQFDIRAGMLLTDNLHEAVTGIAVSHDGNCVLASCLDHTLRLLDKASGESLANYKGEAPGQLCHTHCCVVLLESDYSRQVKLAEPAGQLQSH